MHGRCTLGALVGTRTEAVMVARAVSHGLNRPVAFVQGSKTRVHAVCACADEDEFGERQCQFELVFARKDKAPVPKKDEAANVWIVNEPSAAAAAADDDDMDPLASIAGSRPVSSPSVWVVTKFNLGHSCGAAKVGQGRPTHPVCSA